MREQPTKDIKEELMDKSFEFFSENGLENTSLRDLCKGISVSSGSMYYWFDNKEDIVISTARYALTRSADEIFNKALEGASDIDNLFERVMDILAEYTTKLRFIYQVATSPFYGERLRRKAKEFHSEYELYAEKISALLGVGVDATRPMVYLFMSVFLDYIVWEDEEAVRIQIKALSEYVHIILDRNK